MLHSAQNTPFFNIFLTAKFIPLGISETNFANFQICLGFGKGFVENMARILRGVKAPPACAQGGVGVLLPASLPAGLPSCLPSGPFSLWSSVSSVVLAPSLSVYPSCLPGHFWPFGGFRGPPSVSSLGLPWCYFLGKQQERGFNQRKIFGRGFVRLVAFVASVGFYGALWVVIFLRACDVNLQRIKSHFFPCFACLLCLFACVLWCPEFICVQTKKRKRPFMGRSLCWGGVVFCFSY